VINFNNKKILITRLKFIGDVVLTTPLIKTIKINFPDSKIFYLTEKEIATLLYNNPDLEEVIPLDFSMSFFRYLSFIHSLRKYNFDIIIDLFGNPRSALLSFLSGAKIRIGSNYGWRTKLFTHLICENDIQKDQISHHLSFVEDFSEVNSHRKTKIYLTSNEQEEALDFFSKYEIDIKSRMIGIYPGATWPAKRWFPEKFAILADLIFQRYDSQVIFLKGPKDNEIIEEIKSKAVKKHFYLDSFNLRRTAAIISSFDAFISNDCGLMHISPAVGTYTIGLFGPGEENIWFPYNKEDGFIPIRKDIWCHPCHLDFCDRMDCWKLLRIEDVLIALENILKRL